MKGRAVIVLFLAVLLAAATLYFFFFTEHSKGLILEGIVDANQVVVSPKVQASWNGLTSMRAARCERAN